MTYENLLLDPAASALKKTHDGVFIDLSAIAKGYGVDRVADYRPPALRDLRFRLWLGPGRLSPPLRGIGGLRRYRFPWWWRVRRRMGAGEVQGGA